MNINKEECVLAATKCPEESVDAETAKLARKDDVNLSVLECKIASEFRSQLKQVDKLVARGHGVYTECFSEKEFFDLWYESQRVVLHFYRPSTMRCGIVDRHLSALAPKHIEAKFCKINAERSSYLVSRLKIRMLPTIAVCIGDKTCDYIVGFSDLGDRDDFPTEMLEWRLGHSGVINYCGDLTRVPYDEKTNPFHRCKPTTFQGRPILYSDSD